MSNSFLGSTSGQIVKVLKQTGRTISVPRDKGRIANLAGKRVSRSGKVYWETRKNRSDVSQAKRI